MNCKRDFIYLNLSIKLYSFLHENYIDHYNNVINFNILITTVCINYCLELSIILYKHLFYIQNIQYKVTHRLELPDLVWLVPGYLGKTCGNIG